jgi:hypothetical protein
MAAANDPRLDMQIVKLYRTDEEDEVDLYGYELKGRSFEDTPDMF